MRLWFVPSLWESPVRVEVTETEYFNGRPYFYHAKGVHDGKYYKGYASQFSKRAFRFSMV